MERCNGGKGRDGHDEICFETGHCPVCDMRDELRGEISALREEIAEKEKEISELEAQP